LEFHKYLVPITSYFYFRFAGAILFFTVIIIYLCQTYILWIGHPRKCWYSRWNFTNMLFLTEDFTISGLRHHLGFSYSVHINTSTYPG